MTGVSHSGLEMPDFRLTSRCECGANRLAALRPPILRFFCHCLVCQQVYQKPYADVSMFWARDVDCAPDAPIRFKRYRSPPAVRRGSCVHCHVPVLGLLSPLPGARLAFLPSRHFDESDALPSAAAHIFYHRRVHASRDGLAKYSGYWPSQWYLMRAIARNLGERLSA